MTTPGVQRDEEQPGLVTLHLPCRFRYLALVREVTLDVCEQAGLPEFAALQLEMAVDEACANVIEHGYGGECRPEAEADDPGYRVRFYREPDAVVVEIEDYGGGFDYDGQPVRSPADYVAGGRERGLGLVIIRRFVDAVSYQRGPPAHRLRLTKRF